MDFDLLFDFIDLLFLRDVVILLELFRGNKAYELSTLTHFHPEEYNLTKRTIAQYLYLDVLHILVGTF